MGDGRGRTNRAARWRVHGAWGRIVAPACAFALGLALTLSILASCAPTDAGGSTRAKTATGAAAGPAALPAGMPTHFAFGVMNAPGDVGLLNEMRANNGTAWDFRYQYLTGGVNTGHGWETLQAPAGAFVGHYLRESADNHYVPALVYYELLQSSGQCAGCDEGKRDLTALSDPSLMRAYYANWRLLMQQVGDFGRPTLVIVEPDLWGYMEQSLFADADSAAAVPASVASSGDADAAPFPNTAQGFAWTLLHIRDRLAPHAVLAIHLSPWAAGDDISSSTNPSLDVAYDVKTTASFLQTAGLSSRAPRVSTWDILSADVSVRDSGQGAAWWDPSNQQYPNFARYLSYASGVAQAVGRDIVLWQVPEGNQYFDTENNTPQHTQDNRAQYILAHVDDFARAGIVAVLFGPGNGGTSIDDTAHDGVTNPVPVASFDCDHCNTRVSSYPDDDGGYLRLFVGAYYRHGPLQLANPAAWTPAPGPDITTATPLPAGTCLSSPVATIGTTTVTPNPVAPGGAITVSPIITMSCDTTIRVYVEVWGSTRVMAFDVNHIQVVQRQPTAVPVTSVVPSTLAAGRYIVKVGVFDESALHQEGWDNSAASLVVS